MAGRSAGVLGVRDGGRDPGLVRAGFDRLGAGAGGIRLPAVPRHPDLALLRHGGRPDRQPKSALPDAGHLCRRGDGARRAVPGRPRRAGAGVRPGHAHGPGAALRHHAAQPAGRRDHAGQLPDAGHGRVAHHRRFGARGRRAVGRGPGRRTRLGRGLCRGLCRLRREPCAHAQCRDPAPARRRRGDSRASRRCRPCARALPTSGRRPICGR